MRRHAVGIITRKARVAKSLPVDRARAGAARRRHPRWPVSRLRSVLASKRRVDQWRERGRNRACCGRPPAAQTVSIKPLRCTCRRWQGNGMPDFESSYRRTIAGGVAVALVCLGVVAASHSRPYASPLTQASQPIDQMSQPIDDPQLVAAIAHRGPLLRDRVRRKMRRHAPPVVGKADAIRVAWLRQSVPIDAHPKWRDKPMSAWRRAYIAKHGHQPPRR